MSGKYPNSGIISPNDKKEQPNHADYNGNCEVDGVEYWINGWIKEKTGRKFLSLSFKPKDAQRVSGEENQDNGIGF